MTMATRLHRLERDHRAAQPFICRTCHSGEGEPTYLVTFEESDLPDLCPECGRRQVFRIEFDQRG